MCACRVVTLAVVENGTFLQAVIVNGAQHTRLFPPMQRRTKEKLGKIRVNESSFQERLADVEDQLVCTTTRLDSTNLVTHNIIHVVVRSFTRKTCIHRAIFWQV